MHHPAPVRAAISNGVCHRDAIEMVGAVDSATFLEELAGAGIAGGAVYDGLVGLAAHVHRLPLYSRDRRARSVYYRIGADVRFLG